VFSLLTVLRPPALLSCTPTLSSAPPLRLFPLHGSTFLCSTSLTCSLKPTPAPLGQLHSELLYTELFYAFPCSFSRVPQTVGKEGRVQAGLLLFSLLSLLPPCGSLHKVHWAWGQELWLLVIGSSVPSASRKGELCWPKDSKALFLPSQAHQPLSSLISLLTLAFSLQRVPHPSHVRIFWMFKEGFH
jgi:hypothetical protein